jgi:uncharacterized membrane protein
MRLGYWKIIAATTLFSVNPVLFKMISLDAIEILWTVNFVALLVLVTAHVAQRRTKELLTLKRSAGTLAGLAIGELPTVATLLGGALILLGTYFIVAAPSDQQPEWSESL